MVELDHAALGQLSLIHEAVEAILHDLRRADEWGAADEAERITWTAGSFADYRARGSFNSVLLINDNGFDVYVGLGPSTGQAGRQLFTLGARAWICLPLSGTTFSVGAAAAGSIAIIPLAVTMPPAGSSLQAQGSSYNLTQPTLVDGQHAEIQLNAKGQVEIAFGTSQGFGDGASNPGGFFDPAGGANGRPMAIAQFLFNGASWDRARTPNVFKVVDNVAVGAEVTIWTPAAGKKFRLMGYQLSFSGVGIVRLKDNTAGTLIHEIAYLAATLPPIVSPPMGNGQLSAVANNVLTATGSVAGNLSGVVFGTEE